jgi:hypothetical protein
LVGNPVGIDRKNRYTKLFAIPGLVESKPLISRTGTEFLFCPKCLMISLNGKTG